MASYASGADLLARFDARTLGDLVSDSGTRVASGSLAADTNIVAALADASGEVEAALLMGERYSVANLEGLTGNSLALLKRITCDCAMALLYGRRPEEAWADRRAAAEQVKATHLERLAKGDRVFNVEGIPEAGNPTIGGPTTVEITRLNFIRDQTQHFYPARVMPFGR